MFKNDKIIKFKSKLTGINIFNYTKTKPKYFNSMNINVNKNDVNLNILNKREKYSEFSKQFDSLVKNILPKLNVNTLLEVANINSFNLKLEKSKFNKINLVNIEDLPKEIIISINTINSLLDNYNVVNDLDLHKEIENILENLEGLSENTENKLLLLNQLMQLTKDNKSLNDKIIISFLSVINNIKSNIIDVIYSHQDTLLNQIINLNDKNKDLLKSLLEKAAILLVKNKTISNKEVGILYFLLSYFYKNIFDNKLAEDYALKSLANFNPGDVEAIKPLYILAQIKYNNNSNKQLFEQAFKLIESNFNNITEISLITIAISLSKQLGEIYLKENQKSKSLKCFETVKLANNTLLKNNLKLLKHAVKCYEHLGDLYYIHMFNRKSYSAYKHVALLGQYINYAPSKIFERINELSHFFNDHLYNNTEYEQENIYYLTQLLKSSVLKGSYDLSTRYREILYKLSKEPIDAEAKFNWTVLSLINFIEIEEVDKALEALGDFNKLLTLNEIGMEETQLNKLKVVENFISAILTSKKGNFEITVKTLEECIKEFKTNNLEFDVLLTKIYLILKSLYISKGDIEKANEYSKNVKNLIGNEFIADELLNTKYLLNKI